MEGLYIIFRVTLFLAVSVCCSSDFLFNLPELNGGEITSDKTNIMYYVGETLTLRCKKLGGFTGQPSFQQGARNISQEFVTMTNSTHAVMEKVVTDDDFGVTRYQCLEDGTDGQRKPVGLPIVIHTDYAPTNATDRKLVWLDEKMLIITWKFGNVTYKNDHTTNLIIVSAEWSFDPTDGNNWQLCYKGTARNTSCQQSDITNEWGEVYVRVNITNVERDDTVSTLFPGLRVRDQAKPSPVTKVEVKALNSRTAHLKIDALVPLVYNVTYYTVVKGQRKDDWKEFSNKSFAIPRLHPHYNYTFEIRSKYKDRGYWSELPTVLPSLQMPEDGTY